METDARQFAVRYYEAVEEQGLDILPSAAREIAACNLCEARLQGMREDGAAIWLPWMVCFAWKISPDALWVDFATGRLPRLMDVLNGYLEVHPEVREVWFLRRGEMRQWDVNRKG